MSNRINLTRSSLLRYGVALIGIAFALLFIYPDLAKNLFASGTDYKTFMSHGHCYFWIPSLVVLHVLSDLIIGLSYVAISFTLAYLVYRVRRDIPFHWIFLAFGLFIIACGATHFMEILTVWHATYWLSGYIKLITATASLIPAIAFPAMLPKILKMVRSIKTNSVRKIELERINQELTDEITRRKQIEQALRDSEERFQQFMRYAPIPAFIKQEDGYLIYVNPAFEQVFNLKAEDIYGKNDFELWPQEVARKLRENDLDVLRNNRASRIYENTVSPDGTLRYWLSLKFPLSNTNGECFIAGMGLDLTDRKITEEKLTWLSSIVESSDDAIISKDLNGDILTWNKGAERLFGYSKREVFGKNISLLLPSGSEDEERRIMKEINSGQSVKHYETVRVRKDGRLLDVSLTISPIRDATGKITGASKIARDVTKRKRAEEALKKFAAKLERSNNELQDFATIASHDLQEPLRKVQAFADRLKVKCGDSLSEEGSNYLEKMLKAVLRMETLIEDLLTLSRVSTDALPFVQVDLQRISEEVISDLETLIERTNGRVKINNLGTIDADPLQMRQLLQNLIGNALKFHRPDISPIVKISGEVVCSTNTLTDDIREDMYRLTVEDNGIGFESSNIERIFKVFQRLHGRSEYEGTGIGLAVCRKIADRHGGTITAQSVPGEGAMFIVELPVKNTGEN